MTAWDKLQLGWLNYQVSHWHDRSTHRLGPAEYNTRDLQGLFTLLPDKMVTTVLAPPPEGTYAWYSGKGDDLDNRMTRPLTLPAGTTSLSMSLWYEIEAGWDYFYVSLSNDNGATWSNLSGNRTTTANPNGQNEGNGITGTSGGVFVPATFNVPDAFTGVPVLLRLRYWTDPAVVEKGVLVDQIVAGTFTDGAEATPNGWDLGNWAQSTGLETSTHFNAYLSEFRQYRSYDTALRHRSLQPGVRQHAAQMGRALSLPGWTAHPLLGHVADRQRHQRASRRGPDPAGGLAPDTAPADRRHHRHAVVGPGAEPRRHLRARGHRAADAASPRRAVQLSGAERPIGVLRHAPGPGRRRRRRTACGFRRPAPSSRCSTRSPTTR